MNKYIDTFKRNNLFRYIYYKLFDPKLVFSKEDITPYQLHRKDEAVFLKYHTNDFADSINKDFNYWGKTVEAEYLIHYTNKCMIEPYHGWVINKNNDILKRSMPYGISESTPLPHYIFYKKKKYLDLDIGISMHYNWFNYWHFFNDTIGQLYLLDKLQLDKNLPIIVPSKALEVSYVRDFFKTDYSKKWKWVFQRDDTYVRLNSVYLCKNISNIKEHFIYASEKFKKSNYIDKKRKIFITRSPGRGRDVLNFDELKPVILKYSFEIIECDNLSMPEQAELFSSAFIIMGIHGAGLTNMIFRYPGKCIILEIFPPNYSPSHYYWLAKEFGFIYNAISGDMQVGRSFYLNKEKLEIFLRLYETVVN